MDWINWKGIKSIHGVWGVKNKFLRVFIEEFGEGKKKVIFGDL